jgi:hypothetical protein
VFDRGHLDRNVPIRLGPSSDVAVTARGDAYVATSREDHSAILVRSIPAGARRVGRSVAVPTTPSTAMLSQIEVARGRPMLHLLPVDAWYGVPRITSLGGPPIVGRPLGRGERLLSAVHGSSVVLGVAGPSGIQGAVELRSLHTIGELAMATRLGSGRFVAVVHAWREGPDPADYYEVIRAGATGPVSSFAVTDPNFAESMVLSKFRVGMDGDLYQLTTSPDGVRVLRFSMGGAS